MKPRPSTTPSDHSPVKTGLGLFIQIGIALTSALILSTCDSSTNKPDPGNRTEKAEQPAPQPKPLSNPDTKPATLPVVEPETAGTTKADPKPEANASPAPEQVPSRYRPRPADEIQYRTADAPEPNAPPEKSSKEYHTVGVYYGTNRKPTGSPEPNRYYGKERHREGPMEYGKIDVSIPLHHTIGVVERPKWYKLEFSEDPKKHVVLLNIEPMDHDAYFARIKDSANAADESEALLFIHGYNVSFEDATQRTAQIAFDLDFHGVPIAFSWPSQATLEGYTIDQENAIWSVPHLTQFLIDLQEQTGIKHIHIIAHSMGTRVLTEALANAQDRGFSLKLNNVILAAPDIDADVFKEQILPKIANSAGKLTMYSSSSDTALKVSQKIHGNDRLGLGGPNLQFFNGVDTVNASGIDTSLIGHAYYGSHRVVVRDILNVIIRHLDPPQRDLIRGPLGAWDFQPEKPDEVKTNKSGAPEEEKKAE